MSRFGKLDFELTSSMERRASIVEPDTPFRIAVLGDFSGRANGGVGETGKEIARRRPIPVDRDDVDERPRDFSVELRLQMGEGASIEVDIEEMDDFHPDRLLGRVHAFEPLQQLRRRLNDPETFSDAAEEVRSLFGGPAPGAAGPPVAHPASGADLLAEILGGPPVQAPEPSRASDPYGMQPWLREIVSPHLTLAESPERAGLQTLLDKACGALLAAILHHPDFQALEAAWRGLSFLVSRIETGSDLQVFLFDLSKQELADDLCSTDDLKSAGIFKVLADWPSGDPSAAWSLIVGNYTFGRTREDAEILGRLARIGRFAGAPFIGGAGPSLIGCESVAATPDPDDWDLPANEEDSRAWLDLRELPEAPFAGLAFPRFLLRLPYGRRSDPIDRMEFEEMSDPPRHEEYLWGNPAFACAVLLAQAFSGSGWEMRPGIVREIGGLPAHVYDEMGESAIKPCAEVALRESALEAILDAGLIPLVSPRGQDMARVARFQSIAQPLAELSGRWG